MQISALTDIVEGELLNTPSISFITQVHTNVSKVNDGDAFFALNKEDIPIALKRGAFAIITGFLPSIDDNEIAWIEVENIFKAICNILRYQLLQYKVSFVHIDKVYYSLIETLKNKDMTDVILITDDLYSEFEKLISVTSDKVIFSHNRYLLNSISANITELTDKDYEIKNLTNHSLFETSFSYKNKFFDKIKLPYLYVNHIITILELFKYNLDLKKLNQFKLFEPTFINKSGQIVPFGQTNRFIIANDDPDIYEEQIKYIYKYYNYGEIKILEGFNLTGKDIFEYVNNTRFNVLYIKDKSYIKVREDLTSNDTMSKLF